MSRSDFVPTSLLSELRGENTGLGKQRMIYGGAQRKSTNRRHPHQHHASAPHTHHFNNPLRSPLETATHQRSIAQREVRNQKMAKSQNRRDQWNSVSTMVDHVFNVVSAPASTNNKNDTDGASNEQHSRSTPNYINPTSGSDASPSDLHHPITNDIDSNVSDRNLRNVYIPPKRMQQTLSSPLFGAIPANNDNDRNPTNRHGNNKKEHRTNRNRKTQFNDGRMYHTTARIDDSDDKKKHQLGMLRSQSDAALISSALQTRTTGSTTMNTLNNNKNGRSQANQGGGTHKHSNKKYAQGYGNWGAPYHQVTDDDNMSTNVFSSNNTTHDNARTTHPSANSSSFTELDQYFQLSLPLTNTRHIGKTRVHSSSSSSRSLASSASLRSIHSRGTTARKTRPSSSTSSSSSARSYMSSLGHFHENMMKEYRKVLPVHLKTNPQRVVDKAIECLDAQPLLDIYKPQLNVLDVSFQHLIQNLSGEMSESGKVLEQLYLHMKKIVTVQNQFMTACLGFTETFDDDNDANDNNSTDKSKAQGKGKKGDREGDDNGYVSSDDDMADPSSRGRWKHGSALKEVLGGTPSKHSHSTVSVMTSPPPTRGLQSAQSSATLPSSPLSTSVTFHNKIDYFAKASASAVSSPTLGALNAYNNVDNHTLDIVALSEDKRSLRKQKRKQQREDRYDQVFQETIMKIMDLNTLKVEELRASRLKMDENFHTHQYSKRYVRKTQELQKKITAAKLALDPKLQTKYALQEQELQERIYAQPGDDYNKKIQQKKQDREKNMTRRQKKANLLLHLEAAFDKYFGRYAQALERNRTMSALCLTSKSVIKSLEDRGSVNQKMFSTMLQDTESKLEVELSYKKRIEDDLGDMAHKHKHAMIRVYELEKELEMVKYSTKQLGRTYSGGVAWKQPTREAAVQCDMLKDGSGAAQMLR